MSRRSLGMLALLSLSLYSIGCGSGDTSTSSSQSTATTTTPTTGATVTIPGRTANAPPSPETNTPGQAGQHLSRGASGFRVPKGDNSVPDFGHEAPVSQRQLAVSALTGFVQARARGEWSRVCQYLARPVIRQTESFAKTSEGRLKSCGQVLATLVTGPASERANPLVHGVAAIRIKEKTAFALFYGPNAVKYVMPMQNEHGTWKMTQITPLPYPLGTPKPKS